jgi:hypothetical protein
MVIITLLQRSVSRSVATHEKKPLLATLLYRTVGMFTTTGEELHYLSK